MFIRHFGRTIHRNLDKGDIACPTDIIVIGDGHLIIPLRVAGGTGGLELNIGVRIAIEQPEGHIDPLDLLNMVACGKRFGQQFFPFVMLFQRLDSSFLVQLKGDDIIRLQAACKLAGHHRGVAAVGAAGGGSGLVTDQFCAAGGAVVGFHALLCPSISFKRPFAIRISGSLLCLLFRLLLLFFLFRRRCLLCLLIFLSVQRLDLCYVIRTAAELALQLSAFAGIMERAGTGRTLIIGHLCGHRSQTSSLFFLV